MSATRLDFREALAQVLECRNAVLNRQIAQELRADVSDLSSLHLRSANLGPEDLMDLVTCFRNFPEHANGLQSLSLSFNPIGDAGLLQLVEGIPPSVHTLGMVGCGLTDTSGQAIIDWIQRTRGVSMVCVENNQYSPEMQQAFRALRQSRPEMLLVTQ